MLQHGYERSLVGSVCLAELDSHKYNFCSFTAIYPAWIIQDLSLRNMEAKW